MFGLGKQESKLLEAAWRGDEDTVREVLSAKTEFVNQSASRSLCKSHPRFNEGDTALHLSASMGHNRVVGFLLSLKASVNATNQQGVTPLHAASHAGHAEIVKLLLKHRANPNARDGNGRTPLHEAAITSHLDIEKILMNNAAMADTKDQEGNTPLHEAAKACSEPLVQLLVAEGADINEVNAQHRTPLHLCMINTDHSMMNQPHASDQSPQQSTRQLVELLLNLGANVNAVDTRGETPLDLLSYLEGDATENQLVKLLRANGGEWKRYRHRYGDRSAPSNMADETIVGVKRPKQRRPADVVTRISDDRDQAAIDLNTECMTIGRGLDCELRYRSRTLSRRHCRIEPQDGGYVITDLGSHNGTIVDGERITGPHRLKAGEVITLGAYEFEFDGEQLISAHDELPDNQLQREQKKK